MRKIPKNIHNTDSNLVKIIYNGKEYFHHIIPKYFKRQERYKI
jgi:hypothetical protein